MEQSHDHIYRNSTTDTEALFFLLQMDLVSSKVYDKRDYFGFEIVNYPFLDGDVPRRATYGVYTLCNLLGLLEFLTSSTFFTIIRIQRTNVILKQS